MSGACRTCCLMASAPSMACHRTRVSGWAASIIAAPPVNNGWSSASQSLLSMPLKSFAAPVAICLLGCVIGFATVTSVALRPLSYALPRPSTRVR